MKVSVWLTIAIAVVLSAPCAAQQLHAPTVVRPESGVRVSTEAPRLPRADPRIRAYNLTWYTLYFVGTAWVLIGLGLALRFHVGPRLRDLAERRTKNRFFQTVVFYAGFSLYLTLWHLPLAFYAHNVDRAYGFARQPLDVWLMDHATSYLLGLPTAIAIWFGYWLMRRSPKRWWIWLWTGAAPWIAGQASLWPVVVAPLYNRFMPMPESPLRTRLLDLSHTAGIGDAQVYVVDISRRTTKLNAYVAGLGPTKRIVLWDTTLKALSDDEVVAIMGHEMGHYVLMHTWWNVVAGWFGAFVILWLLSRAIPWSVRRWGDWLGVRAPDDLAGFPLISLLLFVVLFLQTPIESAISRYHEHEADRYGLELTGLNSATARAFITFMTRDYADPDPPRFIVLWFYSHPPLRERVDFALTYRGLTH